ncbi:hypothetical protein [Burkholderia pseudomallei]|uniref:hypothetical protein n=1 Tax=Burkholderia pseudomallei TaxID=28450 RepID=UPI00030F5B2B|nr:hypothetical protein [Burkholderia pseudomallei]KGD15022.1 hypothetical protein DO70_3920 [Burkholderia pseudomallei]
MSRCLKCGELRNYRTLFRPSQPFAGRRRANRGRLGAVAGEPFEAPFGERAGTRQRAGRGGRLESRHAGVLYSLAKSTLKSSI